LQDEGTVAVNNTCQAEGQAINIVGTAAPANPTYGAAGVFQVGFPGQAGPDCPGPNYIVQGMLILRSVRVFWAIS
jgi:apolipoprotein D and lipocalin family protein